MNDTICQYCGEEGDGDTCTVCQEEMYVWEQAKATLLSWYHAKSCSPSQGCSCDLAREEYARMPTAGLTYAAEDGTRLLAEGHTRPTGRLSRFWGTRKERPMADPRMSDAEYVAYKPYVEEIIALINQQISRRPDPKVMEAAWRIGYVAVLTELVRGWRMLPDEMESYLSRVCASVIEDTQTSVRGWDAEGPQRP